jgi:hypothetical protein
MANRIGVLKRLREASRRDHQNKKAQKQEQRKQESDQRKANIQPGEDPDIAGIVPGPQPPLEE